MRRRRTSTLAPGGKMILVGVVGVIVLFVLWQFVIPFFFNRSDSSSQASTPEKTINYTGQVLDATNGRPIPGATLVAGNVKVAEVDETGAFTITQKLSQPQVNVLANGFISTNLTLKDTNRVSVELQPTKLTAKLVDADTNQPLSKMFVHYGDIGYVTDENGVITIMRVDGFQKLKIDLIGYEKVQQAVDLSKLDQVLTLSLHSTRISSKITDSESGQGVPNALITIGDASGSTSKDGSFNINDAPRTADTVVKVRAPGYKIQTFSIAQTLQGIKLVPFKFQGVYVPGMLAIKPNYNELFTPYLKMARDGKINAIVVDLKHDDTGKLLYDSKIPLANQLGLVYDANGFARSNLIDVPKLLKESHDAGLYVVARFVAYRDPAIAAAKPEWSLKNRNTGQPWKDNSNLVWPNPLVPEIGDYITSVATELSSLGFDEVQLDYIRFPTDGKLSDVDYGGGLSWSVLGKPENEKMRTAPINRTVSKVYSALRNTNTYLSLDVFGYSLWLTDDVGIGQQYNDLVTQADYICPMVYPSHFEPGTDGYDNPGLYPGEIIAKSGKYAKAIETKLPNVVARYRPWLEDFAKNFGPAKYQYKNSPERVKAQVNAAIAGGASGFTLWNATGNFTVEVLPTVKKS